MPTVIKISRKQNTIKLRHISRTFKIVHSGRRGPQGPAGPPGGVNSINGQQGNVTGIAVDDQVVHLVGDEDITGQKVFNGASNFVIKLPDFPGEPGIPDLGSYGYAGKIQGEDGSNHLYFLVDTNGLGKYQADILGLANLYIGAGRELHLRPFLTIGEGDARLGRTLVSSDSTRNYLLTAGNYSGSTSRHYIIGRYNGPGNAYTQFAYFDKDDGDMLIGGSLGDVPDAKLHVISPDATVQLFESTTVGGTGRVGFKDINTTSGSAVTLGAFGDTMVGRAESVNVFRVNAIGIYTGGNVVPTAHLDVAASATGASAIRIRSGVDPTTPNNGDFWYDGTNIKFRDASTTHIIPYDSTLVHIASAEIITGAKTFAPTNSTTAFIVANSGVATHMLRVDTTNGRVGINLATATALNATLAVNGNSVLGGGATTPTARADIGASTTSFAALRVRAGVAPSSPNDGEIWYDGTDLKMRVGAITKTFTLV